VARIRDAYARRQHGPQDSYSFLNPSYVLMVTERESGIMSTLSRYGAGHWKESEF